MRRALTAALACCAALWALAPAAQGASEPFGIHDFDLRFENLVGGEAQSASLAGSHPDQLSVTFKANTSEEGAEARPSEPIKDVEVKLPAGFVGNQSAVPQCTTVEFLDSSEGPTGCSDASAVGLVEVEIGEGAGPVETPVSAAIFNLTPVPGSVARLGFKVAGVLVTVSIATAPTPPYNLVASTRNISQVLEFYGVRFTLWGTPAAKAHDEERGACYLGGKSCPAGIAPVAFLTLPRACEGPLATEYETDSWPNPGVWVEGSVLTHDDADPPNPAGMQGCGSLGLQADLAATPTNAQAESSSGIEVRIDLADEGLTSPVGRANADLEKIVTTLPAGVTANPSAAEGLGVCTEAQYESASLRSPGCPGASKLGTVEVRTPLLKEHPIAGSVYLAAPRANPFGSLLALYLVLRDEELGVFVRQAGRIDADAATGRLRTTFDELPPFPLERISLKLNPGPRAALVTPPACGTYDTETVLHPSSGGPAVPAPSSFTVSSGPGGGPCPAALPFAPGFEAGSENNAAGSFSPFTMRITRQDGEQDITRFSATLPPGVVGKIAGVAQCSEAAIAAAKGRSGAAELAAPSCPEASRLGRVLAGAGVGDALTYVGGSLYLAPPYNGAPLSVVAIVPAVAGPFDVGTVVTRVALDLNPNTGEVEVDGAASDPIPHILEGIPLKVRDLRIVTDRPEFTTTPTSCSVFATAARIGGGGQSFLTAADDTLFDTASRYQAASCASLDFKPRLTLRFRGQTKRTGHPAVRAELRPRSGEANIGRAVTFLPKTTFVDAANVPGVCTRDEFAESACPKESILGRARAFTPLLGEPLEGNVYFRSNGSERELPDIVADLRGQFRIVLVGFVDSRHERIRTRFLNIPDAPVSRFVLNLRGGKNRGLVQNSADLCRHRGRAILNLAGQNGATARSKPKVKVSCKRKGKRSGRHSRAK